MIDSYQLAVEGPTIIKTPIAAAARGGAGGLRLLYAADIVGATGDRRYSLDMRRRTVLCSILKEAEVP